MALDVCDGLISPN